MGQKDFNRMMGDYLDVRRKNTPTKKKKKRFSSDPDTLTEISSTKVHIVKQEDTGMDRFFKRITGYLNASDPKKEEQVLMDENGDSIEKEDEKLFEKEDKQLEEEVSPSGLERFKAWLFSFKSSKETFVEDDFEEEMREEAEEILEKEEHIEEEERELEKEKAGFVRRFMMKIGLAREPEHQEEEFEEDQIDPDLKEIAKVATKVMKMLPTRKFQSFKESEDFIKFKEILDRRDLLKKK